jgi:uncharacterized protein YjiS (DUF1127 family)
MNTRKINFDNPQDIFDNLDELTLQARRARAEAIGELAGIVAAKIVGLAGKLAAWKHQRNAAAQLMQLDDRMLADIGIGRSEIQATIAGRMNNGAVNSNNRDRSAA